MRMPELRQEWQQHAKDAPTSITQRWPRPFVTVPPKWLVHCLLCVSIGRGGPMLMPSTFLHCVHGHISGSTVSFNYGY